MEQKIKEKIVNLNKQQDGYTMIIVLCLLGLFLVLSLSIMFAASLSVNRATKLYAKEQCRTSAITLSKELEEQLNDSTSELSQYVWNSIIGSAGIPYYEPTSENIQHSSKLFASKKIEFGVNPAADYAKKLGAINLEMYWQVEDEEEKEKKIEWELVMNVTADLNEESYQLTSRYAPNISEEAATEEWKGDWTLSERNP